MNKQTPSSDVSLDLKNLRYQLSEHLHYNFDYYIKQLRLQYYSSANKPGAFLAKQMKKHYANKKIQFLTNPQGKRLHNPLDIANEFSAFYAKLYNLKDSDQAVHPKTEDIEAFLSSIQLPSISTNQLETLSTPFSPTEILQAIKKLPQALMVSQTSTINNSLT